MNHVFKSGRFAPAVWSVLNAIPEEYLFHVKHNKRHPKSLYNASIDAISKQWSRVFTEFDRLNLLRERYNHELLLREYRELLYRLNEHHDVCLSILCCLSSSDRHESEISCSQFLKRIKMPGFKAFIKSVEYYRKSRIGFLVNAMKHDQADLEYISFHFNEDFRPGYYLKSIVSYGMLGPSPKIHSDGRTAFSFSRDMMEHLRWLYEISESLANAIEAILDSQYRLKLDVEPMFFENSDFLAVLRSCSNLPPKFFPDEVKIPYPKIILDQKKDKFSIEFPVKLTDGFPEEMKITVNMKFDEMHPSFKLPYFGSDYEKWFSQLKSD